MASSALMQQKFANLRKRLDQLGYRQPLGVESLPLVEKLFADLIHTTESLKKSKLASGGGSDEPQALSAQIEPYKSDNAKLVRENNELHLQHIKQKEEAEFTIKDLKASLRKLEHENADLKFLNNQYIHKIRVLEKESKDKTDKILHLQEKNFHAVVQTPGGKKKTIPFRRQRMEIDSTLPPAERPQVPPGSQVEDPFVADLLQLADKKIEEMTGEVKKYKDLNEIAEGKIKNLRTQVDQRDEEIDRLGRMLDGGRPYDVVALETRNRANERMISHLNIQIDYLQQKNREYQRRLDEAQLVEREARSETIDLNAKNKALAADLEDVDRMAQSLQLQKDSVMRSADMELSDAKIELERSRQELQDLDLTVSQLREEKQQYGEDNAALRSRLSSREADYQRLEELMAKVQEDKKRLSQRVNKLTSNERELVLEIERLKKKNGLVKKRGKSPNRLDAFIRGLEEERDYYKGEVDTLQKMMQQQRSASPARGRSPARAKRDTSPGGKSAAHYETIVRVLEDERDFYKKEYEKARTMSRTASPARSPPTRDRSVAEETELLRVTRERNELQALLDKFERHMAEIQSNVKVLTSERDKLNLMYEQTKEELQRMRRDVVKSPKSPKVSLAAQAVLRRVENERDDAIADLRRMTTERDSMRERLKMATETSLSDRARLEQKIEDLENALHNVEVERNELQVNLSTQKALTNSSEDQCRELNIQLNAALEDGSQHKATATQMRLLAEQTEEALEEHRRRLTRKEGDLKVAEERILRLEERSTDLQRANVNQSDQITQLRGTISALDGEKDSLQMTVDEKSERIAGLDAEVVVRDRQISDLRINIGELEAQLDRANENINQLDREIKSLRRQLDSTTEELSETTRGREVALRENRRLQDDLAAMTRENQNLNQDLQDTIDEREELKNQVQDYVMEVKRVEELLAAKDQELMDLLEQYQNSLLSASHSTLTAPTDQEDERGDLLNQYRVLSREAERYETQTHQLESEGSNLRLELMSRDSEVRRLRDKVELMEREIQEHLHAQQAYETQVSSLTRSVSQLEDNLRVTEDERLSVQQDLAAVRDLCAKLEATKDSLQRQLTGKTLDQEQLQAALDELKADADALRSQVNSERGTVRNLEGLLSSNREKEFQTQLSAQEKNAEIQLLKDRLTLNESKLQSQNREMSTLRTKNMELDSEVERLRRQLTSERFEK
ncbi:centrosomal protein of 135 kDa [Lingula anatina]|uniref:Centrosomal protein of 135 kDa n=1 Tax=Lingula anatina TaxID=7574 RepID=A0A1S3I289_LINAN|nr:centrosomal protein of 135 kDa [Lingula anatina]|eukprot:XP_013391946.1 centrosomal protein of 135 kDa [Lingula anatina]